MDTTHRWHPLVRDWLRDLRSEHKSEKTLDIYGNSTRQFIDWLDTTEQPPQEVGDIERGHVADWMIHLLDKHSAGNANTRYRSLRQWFKWLLAEGEIDVHPMEHMKPPTVPESPPPIVPDDLMRKVLDGCKGRDVVSRRDTAIIRLLWDTGARLSEVANLKLDDVDLELDVIHVLGKGKRGRSVPFGAKTGKAITRYLRARAADKYADHPRLWLGEKNRGPLTPNGVKQMLRRRGQAAGVNEQLGRNLHAHLGRHSVAHHWQAAEGSEGDLMLVMGWRSPQMPKRYGKSAAAERAQAAARRMRLGDRL